MFRTKRIIRTIILVGQTKCDCSLMITCWQSARCSRCAIPSSSARTVRQSNSHVDILEVRRVTKGKGYAEETKTFGDTVEYLAPGPCAPLHTNYFIENMQTSCWVRGVSRQGREDTHSVHVLQHNCRWYTELPKPPRLTCSTGFVSHRHTACLLNRRESRNLPRYIVAAGVTKCLSCLLETSDTRSATTAFRAGNVAEPINRFRVTNR